MAELKKTYRWQQERKAFLMCNPLCVMCRQAGHTTAARIVDHIRPHRGDAVLFWDQQNWQPLCKQHHDSAKQRLEKSGNASAMLSGVDSSGKPTHPDHPWNK
jgi:5-methylcytosine-specific restriction endonuclease McrA